MQYPPTPPEENVETIHGYRIRDNYRWLENGQKPKVKKWITAQNKLTDRFIPKKIHAQLEEELRKNYKFKTFNSLYPCNGKYFWWEHKPGQEQGVLYVRKGLKGKKISLIDPNKLSNNAGHIVSLDYWFPSPQGKYLAYGISQDGSELSALEVIDVENGEKLEVVAKNASWASLVWTADESGFYYTKYPNPGSVPKREERYHQKVYYHKVGTSSNSDKEIFGKGRPKEDMLWLELSVDDMYLVISASQNWERNDLYLYDVRSKKTKNLLVGFEAQFGLTFTNNKALLSTNYKTPNLRILSADKNNLPTHPNQWKSFIPERKHKIGWYQITKKQVLIVYLKDAVLQGVCFNLDGKETSKLPMQEHSSILEIGANRDEAEFFYQSASFVSPGVTHHYDPSTAKITKFDRMKSALDETNYVTKQEWFRSKDGTKIPLFIVHHKELKLSGKNPTILYGYGGFEVSLTPGFLRSFVPWLENGGVYVSANIRGGGEFGKDWHLGAIKENKQKSYDDFIAAAEHLISKKYTSSQYLGILGASNGGLLVSAVAVQRPELFKAVVSQVPLTDMVRFPELLIASRWTPEYGDPGQAEDLENILKFSPYHNVKDNKEYPAFLFTTAENDSRVDPMHARKMTALLQNTNTKNPVLLYTESSTGHTGSLTMSRFYKNHARVLAFFADTLKLRSWPL